MTMKALSIKRHIARILALLMIIGAVDAGTVGFGSRSYAVSMGTEIQGGDTLTLKAGDWEKDYLVLNPVKTNSGEAGTFVLQKHFISSQQISFDASGESNVWEGSDAQAYCAEYYRSMPDALKNSVKGVMTGSAPNNINGTREGDQADLDKVFLLSLPDYNEYKDHITASGDFWLRTPSSSGSNIVAYISSRKEIKTCLSGETKVARPAFNLILPEDFCASSEELSDGKTDWVIDMDHPGHSYGEPEYTWSGGGEKCSAHAECVNCGKTVRENAYATSDLAADGSAVYTAEFENEMFSTQTKTVRADTLTGSIRQGDILRFKEGSAELDFIVLDPAKTSTGSDGMFLLLRTSTEKTEYDESEQSNQWEGSTAQAWCTAFYDALPKMVRDSIIGVRTRDSESGQDWLGVNNIDGTKTDKDKVFFLSYKEYSRYRDVVNVVAPYKWLLRNYGVDCASDIHAYVGVIQENGEPKDYGIHSSLAARPAFNIELGADVKAAKTASGGVTVWTINTLDPTAVPESPYKPTVSPDSKTKVKVDLPAVKTGKPKAGKRRLTVRWKKVSSKNRRKIQGIEIQVARDKKFKKIVKKTTAGKTKTAKTVKGLKKKQYYWVRVRAYKKSGSVKHVSKWSAAKRVRVR